MTALSIHLETPEPDGHSASPSGLRKNYLSLFEVLAQTIGTVSPSAVPGLLVPVVFAAAGNGTWAVLAFATVAGLLLTTQINIFASRLASPGSLYAFVAEGLGSLAGVIAGWSLLIAYLAGAGSALSAFVSMAMVVVRQATASDPGLAWQLSLTILGAVGPWYLAQRSIRISARLTSILEFMTIGLVLALIGAFFLRHGTMADQDQLRLTNFSFPQFRSGLVLAFFCLAGFESAATLGGEARSPFRTIPRALTMAVLLLGSFFVVSSYGMVEALRDQPLSLDKQSAPLTVLADALGWHSAGILVALGITISIFAGILGCLNAAGRVLYTYAHRGLLHTSLRPTHSRNATPHLAIGLAAVITFTLSIAFTLCRIPLLTALGYLGSISTFGILTAYVLIAIAAPIFLRRRDELRGWHVAASAGTLLALAIPLAGSLYPVPDWPYNLLPYIFLALLVAGTAYFIYLKHTDPDRLDIIERELLAVPAGQPGGIGPG